MTVFSKVVTGVKRRIPAGDTVSTASASTSDVVRTKEGSQPVAPDLRRFSDFMNPFPTVSPGGYTKYYKTKGGVPAGGPGGVGGPAGIGDPSTSPYALPSLCELNQRPPAPRRAPPIQTSGLAKAPRSSRPTISIPTTGSSTLAPIPESSLEMHKSSKSKTLNSSSSSSPHASLRRRNKRRLLRTPSVERDFNGQRRAIMLLDDDDDDADSTAALPSTTLNRADSTSSSQSSSSTSSSLSTQTSNGRHRTSPHSSNSSSDSHSSESSYEASPLTPMDSVLPAAGTGRGYLFKTEVVHHHRKKLEIVDWEPFERPDSRSTYRTARTHFDDI